MKQHFSRLAILTKAFFLSALNMKLFVISSLLFFSAFYASAEKLDISCKLTGFKLNDEGNKYENITIVEGNFNLEVGSIADKPDAQPFIDAFYEKYPDAYDGQGYVPLGERSKLFGEEGGTRLQISVWVKDKSPDEPYAGHTVVLNGLRITSSIPLDRNYTTMMLNEDILDNPALVSAPSEEDLVLEQSPLILPEGEFDFLYSRCKVSWPDRANLLD